MKKVLYLSNIEVPYRVRFFNELAQYCDLTVLYERELSSNRNAQWAKSEEIKHRVKYLHGIKIARESAFSFGVLKEIFAGYDAVIVGCYNSPAQMMAILAMRLAHKPYIINLDGEPFLDGSDIKVKLKRFFLSGAEKYLVAGEKSAQSIKKLASGKEVIPYYFSSLSEREMNGHAIATRESERNETILVVGQYFDYKGMDIALEAARMDLSLRYKFVGMGSRTEQFLKDFEGIIPENVEIIPFLQKQDLEKEYQSCGMLVLPSRQECWGLVINEAASFGMPIVSTWGSGAAVEFLADRYPQFLAKPGNPEDLLRCIRNCRVYENKEDYQTYLLNKAAEYTIEKSVQAHVRVQQCFENGKVSENDNPKLESEQQ